MKSKNSKQRARRKVVIARKPKQTATTDREISALGKVIRSIGSIGGTALGGMIGSPAAGGSIGHSLAGALSRWIGAGDYTVSSNSLTQRAAQNIPMMHTANQSIIVRHREFIGTIYGSSSFAVQAAYTINPGLPATFPWLSGIAANYQEYKIRGMVYHYVPSSGTAISGTNSALGTVMIQTSYRSSDSQPTTKQELLNEYWSNEVVPSDTMCHPIECDPKENPFNVQYVRNTGVPNGDSLLMYDLGTTYVATQGMQGTNAVGDLWVTYEVELKKPVVTSNVVTPMVYFNKFASTTVASPFSNPGSATGNLPLTFTGTSILIPAGYSGKFFIVLTTLSTAGFGGAITYSAAFTPVNCVATSLDSAGNTFLGVSATAITACTSVSYICAVLKADASVLASVTLPTLGGVTGTMTGASLQVYSFE